MEEELEREITSLISKSYMTRRFSEVIDNSFLARNVTNTVINTLTEQIGKNKLAEHFSYITSFITKDLDENRQSQEEQIFLDHLNDGRLELAVSDNKSVGYKIPESDNITTTNITHSYDYNLYTDVEISTMNDLEKSVVNILEDQEKLLWWFRNRVGKEWYAIQGWHEHKIRPDFVAAKKKDDETIEVLYIIESKGEHLAGNPDTVYKKKVMDKMTELKRGGDMNAYQTELGFGQINDSVEAYLVKDGDEEEELRKLLN